MPELPEVETMRRGILPIIGARIEGVTVFRLTLKPLRILPRPPTFRRRLLGDTILAIDRLGKRIAVGLASSRTIVFEPRMTGLVLLADAPDENHLRLGLSLSGVPSRSLWYWDRRGLGSVRLLSQADLDQLLERGALGPDALAVTAGQLRDRMRHSQRPIKVALLDQKAVAGIGNLYAAEILHVARISPFRRCAQLSRSEWSRLHAAMQQVLTEAIRYEGSTLSDGTYRNALNQVGSYQNHHLVYGKADEPCPSCGRAVISRIVQAQRSTFYCPICQPLRPRREP